MMIKRGMVLGVAGLLVAAAGLECSAQIGGPRNAEQSERRAPDIDAAIRAYAERLDWKPVAVVVVENNDAEMPQLDAKRDMIAEMISTALNNAGMQTKLPGESAFGMEGGNEQDRQMREDGTLLNLMQFMGGDCLVKVSLNDFSYRDRPAGNRDRRDYVLRMSVRVIDPVVGAARGAEMVTKEATAYADNDQDFVLGDLLDEAIRDVTLAVAGGMEQTTAALKEVQGMPSPTIKAYVNCVDMTLPDVREVAPGNWQKADSTVEVCPRFMLKVGGVAMGTGPGVFDLAPITPGLHMVEISAEGFEPRRTKMFIKDGMTLKDSLVMTPENRRRWMEQMRAISELRQAERLTDAQVELIKGQAEFLRNSNYSINIAYDMKSNIEARLDHQYDSGNIGGAEAHEQSSLEYLKALEGTTPSPIQNNMTINDIDINERGAFSSLWQGTLATR